MNESHVIGYIASAMQFIVAAYALRLNRHFGTSRVGWSLFGAFSLLALLQLIQSTTPLNAAMDSALKINVSYALISFLLLIGMLHMETMLKERLRRECFEKQLRAELELELQSKTAHLNRAIEELMGEIEETKRMSAIIESAEWAGTGNTVHDLAAGANTTTTMLFDHSDQKAAGQSISVSFPTEADDNHEQALACIFGGELLAHF